MVLIYFGISYPSLFLISSPCTVSNQKEDDCRVPLRSYHLSHHWMHSSLGNPIQQLYKVEDTSFCSGLNLLNDFSGRLWCRERLWNEHEFRQSRAARWSHIHG